MESEEIEAIKAKTTTSIIFLTFRNIGIQAISMLGFFLLTILLGTAEIGLFAIVAESVSILGYFSDVGLAPTLIQQKAKPTIEQLRTTFLIQQILVIVALITVSIIYPSISTSRHYGSKELWITVSLCFAFLAASLKTIPSILLERELNFKLLSTIDIIENITFYFVAVIFALWGYGAFSYAIATFVRSILGLVIIYIYSWWPVGLYFSLDTTKALFKYGIPFQLNSFIAMAKDRLSNILVAGIIGRESFGLLAWAQKGPRIPLSFMDAIMKVTFPTFARIQDEALLLQKSLSRSIFFIALVVFPLLAGISVVAPDLILLIPKYSKWSPAIFPMYLFAISAAIAAVTTPLTNAFNAVGKIAITTKLMIMWTILTWLTFPILSHLYGFRGTSVANLLVGLSSVVVWVIAHRIFNMNVLTTIFHPLIGTSLLLISTIYLNHFLFAPFLSISLKIIIGTLVYTLYLYYFCHPDIKWFFNQLKWPK
ncbi:MAG: oligosaccharide flippase family protein [Microgenomates group bacterium]